MSRTTGATMTGTTDISIANVARVLRIAEQEYLFLASSLTKPEATVLAAERAAECRDLADAMTVTPVPDVWTDSPLDVLAECHDGYCATTYVDPEPCDCGAPAAVAFARATFDSLNADIARLHELLDKERARVAALPRIEAEDVMVCQMNARNREISGGQYGPAYDRLLALVEAVYREQEP